jgi:hypothetical protein
MTHEFDPNLPEPRYFQGEVPKLSGRRIEPLVSHLRQPKDFLLPNSKQHRLVSAGFDLSIPDIYFDQV